MTSKITSMAFFILWLNWQAGAAQATEDILLDYLKDTWSDQYSELDDASTTELQDTFLKLLHLPDQGEYPMKCGFEVTRVGTADDTVLVLHEKPEFKRGNGIYMIRPYAKRKILWQSPHSSFDKYTDGLTLRFFLESDSLAAAWNTVHRSQIDVAHTHSSSFQSFTMAFGQSNPDGRVIQMHGFSQSKRRSAGGRHAEIIISNGNLNPPDALSELAARLANDLKMDVFLFGKTIWELGATTNVQYQGLEKMGFTKFLHLELSLETRQRLMKSSPDRALFLDHF